MSADTRLSFGRSGRSQCGRTTPEMRQNPFPIPVEGEATFRSRHQRTRNHAPAIRRRTMSPQAAAMVAHSDLTQHPGIRYPGGVTCAWIHCPCPRRSRFSSVAHHRGTAAELLAQLRPPRLDEQLQAPVSTPSRVGWPHSSLILPGSPCGCPLPSRCSRQGILRTFRERRGAHRLLRDPIGRNQGGRAARPAPETGRVHPAGKPLCGCSGELQTLMGPQHVARFQTILRTELDRSLDGR